ncbi:hypothetical protein GOV04_02830 [Candidatus Woesearchaeota archaeon]|nr:hypothetical protein [Candidatus Woesearchaeota archaeon]
MRVGHRFGKFSLQKEVGEKKLFSILSNKTGAYFMQSLGLQQSKFQGFHIPLPTVDGWDLAKIIDRLDSSNKVESVTNELTQVTLNGTFEETFFMPKDIGAFSYQAKNAVNQTLDLVLDMRSIYDFSTTGRVYNRSHQDNKIIIECRGFFLVIMTNLKHVFNGVWEPADYSFDETRGENMAWWVYRALRFNLENDSLIVFAASTDLETAENQATNIFRMLDTHKHLQERRVERLTTSEKDFSTIIAKKSLYDLVQDMPGVGRGIFAGLPWFFHYWTRDELISLKALMLQEKYSVAKEVLFKYLRAVQPDGRIPNRLPHADLASSDGIGWLYKRLYDYVSMLEEKKLVETHLPMTDLVFIEGTISYSIKRLMHNHYTRGLFISSPQESWMDTRGDLDPRLGARVEINALAFNAFKLLSKLNLLMGNDNQGTRYQKVLVEHVATFKKTFFDGKNLFDGEGDDTIRPNIFLACYALPELLTKKEWQKIFVNALPKLWCQWDKNKGGLATIDKSSLLFRTEHTGGDDESYHRGDNWFFVNNIAAIALQSVNARKFKKEIKQLLFASEEDLLYNFGIGHASEISSALNYEPFGCPAQAWSAATFIEAKKLIK